MPRKRPESASVAPLNSPFEGGRGDVTQESADITKEATVKAFLKANTTQRISVDAIPAMLTGLNDLALQITHKAEALSKAEQRTTILGRDIQEACKTLGGGIDNTPEGLFTAIEKLEPETIGQLALKIAAWVKEHRLALGIGLPLRGDGR